MIRSSGSAAWLCFFFFSSRRRHTRYIGDWSSDVCSSRSLAGAGLNTAQRVMDCGDAGHILLSKRVADDLGEYGRWRPLLHDLGLCEVKHGARVAIVDRKSVV